MPTRFPAVNLRSSWRSRPSSAARDASSTRWPTARLARAPPSPALQQQFEQLSHVRSEWVGRLSAPAGPPAAAAAHRDAIKALRTRMDELEAALSAASDEFRTQVAPVPVAAVQTEIPADAALVEFVR